VSRPHLGEPALIQTAAEHSPNLPSSAEGLRERPTSDRMDLLITSALFALTVFYLLAFLRYSALEPDEGIVLQGAHRILDGQLPYRDFFSFYTPGSFYLVAALFKIFGDSFAVARFSIVVVGGIFPVLTYAFARRGSSRSMALFVALLTVVAGVAYRFLVLHNWYSTLFACLALYSALRIIETHRAVWAFTAGTLCSITALFEQSKGAGLFFGLGLGFLTLRLVQRKQFFRGRELAGLFAGLVGPFLLLVGYFGAKHGLRPMLKDWMWPLHHYGLANHVAYGYQNWSDRTREMIFHSGPPWAIALKVLIVSSGFIVPALPLIAVGVYGYCLVRGRKATDNSNAHPEYIVFSGVLIGLVPSVALSRADIIHFMYLVPLWLVPLAWVLDASKSQRPFWATCRTGFVCFLALSFGLMGLALLTTAAGAHQATETRRGLIRTGQIDSVMPYIDAHVSAGTPMLVYPYLPLYYYLTGTRSVSRLDYFQPGMNTPEQAEEIIAQLKAHPASPVLFEPAFLQKIGTSWPDTPSAAIGEYVVQNFRVCRLLRSGSGSLFEYMVSREGDCP
jgi:dolichyl-phosphate-mannose-protein mannosyltransferase